MLERVKFNGVQIPKFSEVLQRTEWVLYGEDNNVPNYLISRYHNSAIHKAVLVSKLEQICGNGLICLSNPMLTVTPMGTDTVDDLFRKLALDYILFGGFGMNVIWSRDKKTIAEIHHLDFSRLRSGKINPETDKIDRYFYSPDWSNTRKFPPTPYDAFGSGSNSEIFYYKNYSPGNSYYPEPDYSGAMAAIEIEVQIKQFHTSNLNNGMAPGLWINYNNGTPVEDIQRKLVRELEEQFSSPVNAGMPVICFNESKELAPEIVQIPKNENDGYYNALFNEVVNNILSGHRVSSGELYGVSQANKLGSKDEIKTHIEYFNATVIRPYQRVLLKELNKLVSLKTGTYVEFQIKPMDIFTEDGTLKDKETE